MYLGNKLINCIFWKHVAVSVLFAYKWRLFNNFIFYDFKTFKFFKKACTKI
jgi:hypothetical protein